MSKIFGCSPEGRKICKGICCTSPIASGRYFEEELKKLPKRLQNKLEHVEESSKGFGLTSGGYYQVKKKHYDDPCPFIKVCLKNPDYKPIQCWLFPFRVSKNGKLFMTRWAWLHCCRWKKGKEAWVSMEEDLKYVFGDKFYEKLKEFMESDLPDDGFNQSKIEDWL